MERGMKTWILNTALSGLLLMFTVPALPAGAAVPELINFQGKLADSVGKPITTAVPMVFKLYQGATGGSPVWTETQSVTPDIYGIYSVMLGEVTPFDISFSTSYWLGVAVGTDVEMLPRYRMVSSAYSLYSLNSATAAWAGGADWSTITNIAAVTAQGNVFNGASQLLQMGADGKLPAVDGSNLTGLPTAFLADGAVTTAKLAANAVTDAKVSLSTAAIGSGRFGDDRVAVSTQAISGGVYNSAGKLVQMGADGFLPALNGSNLTALTKTQVGLGSADNTSDAAKPVSTAQQTALNLKANLSGATFTGAIAATNLAGTNTGDETAVTIKSALGAATASTDGYLASSDWAAFNGKLAPAGNGSLLTGMTAGQVGLGSVDNTSDAAKPVSTAQQTALNLKANLSGATFTGAIAATNLSGSNTGDESAATIKTKLGAATASTDGYLTSVNWATFNGKLAPTGNGSSLTGMTAGQVGLGSVDNTSDAAKPVSTAQQTALDLKANLAGAIFTGAISATNLSGTNTGDQTNITGNAGTVTNGVYTTGTYANPAWITSLATGKIDLSTVTAAITPMQVALSTAVYTSGNQTISGIKTFSSTITGDISGNAATVTTNANLTGVVTSVGNATSIGAGAITNAMLFNGAVASLSGTNTGDNAVNSLYSGLVTNATHTGDATGATALTVVGINGTSLAGLATGILKNTTGTGVPSIAVAGDFPVLNQNTTGNAATATSLTGLTASVANLNTVTGALGTAAFTASGAYATAAQGTLAANALPSASFTDAAVTGKLLTGYVSGAGTVAATDTILQAIQKLGGNDAAPSGDVYKASTQTFTGLNTFTSTITAKGFSNMSQSVVLNSVTTFAADGSGVVLMTFNGTGSVATITGCSSGDVGQGQIVVFVVSAWSVGGISFVDTIPAAAANDTMLLNGAAGTWTPPASAAALGAAITLLCTSVNTATPPATNMVKLWVEVGRSLSGV